MSKRKLHVFCSEVDRDGSRSKIKNAWIYWRTTKESLILRANAQGHVLRHAAGDPAEPSSYTEQFIAEEGEAVRVAYNDEEAQLEERSIVARLKDRQVVFSLDASLARLGPILVPPGGKKVEVKVLPLSEVRLPKYQPLLRAVAVTTFGGEPGDIQATNMDRFLAANYGTPGGQLRVFRGDEERGFREEGRRVIKASGTKPLHIIRDIATAARSLENDGADERVVGLALHGNSDRIGRLLLDAFLTEKQLLQLQVIKNESAIARKKLKAAKEKLERARASGDLDDVRAAEEEVASRQSIVDGFDPDALEMLGAFEGAAAALEKSRVAVVELQACDTADGPGVVASFGFLGRLETFLSTVGDKPHRVSVLGHAHPIVTKGGGKEVTVWIGADTDEGKPGSQTSKTSLPLP